MGRKVKFKSDKHRRAVFAAIAAKKAEGDIKKTKTKRKVAYMFAKAAAENKRNVSRASRGLPAKRNVSSKEKEDWKMNPATRRDADKSIQRSVAEGKAASKQIQTLKRKVRKKAS